MKRLAALLLATCAIATGCSSSPEAIVLGAIYPLSGSQARGGIAEHRGVQLAATLINERGGIEGHPVELRSIDVPSSDAAAAAVANLAAQDVKIIVGSYGSTISEPAAAEAARRGLLFWETGAVGEMAPIGQGRSVFRFAPTGGVLGSEAVDFVAGRLAPMLHRSARSLRFAVANVDDGYGRAVAAGALDAIRAKGLRLVGRFPYDLLHADYRAIVRRMAPRDRTSCSSLATWTMPLRFEGRPSGNTSRSSPASGPPPATACPSSGPRSAPRPSDCSPRTSRTPSPSTRPGFCRMAARC